jgi:hypothetical protein
MGAIKDIYDILSDITAKLKSRKLQQVQDDQKQVISDLIAEVSNLKSRIQQLERDHSAAIARIRREDAAPKSQPVKRIRAEDLGGAMVPKYVILRKKVSPVSGSKGTHH